MNISATYRVNYAMVHLVAAARWARKVGDIESTNGSFGSWWEEMRDYSVSCLLLTSACLEAYANELFADRSVIFPNVPAHAVDKVWELSERKSPIEKLSLALELKQSPPFDKESACFQSMRAVLQLRNELTHFKPEWANQAEKHVKISDQLKGRFPYNQQRFPSEGVFPRAWAGHGCAKWAVTTTKEFLEAFELQAGLKGRTDWSGWAPRLTLT